MMILTSKQGPNDHLNIFEINQDTVKVEMSYLPQGSMVIGTPTLKMIFTKTRFRLFQQQLGTREAFQHCSGSLWFSTDIYGDKKDHPYGYRAINICYRLFVISWSSESAVLSKQVIDWLQEADI